MIKGGVSDRDVKRVWAHPAFARNEGVMRRASTIVADGDWHGGLLLGGVRAPGLGDDLRPSPGVVCV